MVLMFEPLQDLVSQSHVDEKHGMSVVKQSVEEQLNDKMLNCQTIRPQGGLLLHIFSNRVTRCYQSVFVALNPRMFQGSPPLTAELLCSQPDLLGGDAPRSCAIVVESCSKPDCLLCVNQNLKFAEVFVKSCQSVLCMLLLWIN